MRAGVRLTAVEDLRNVLVTVTSAGPISLAGPATTNLGSLAAGSQTVANAAFTVTGDGLGTVHAAVTGVTASGVSINSADDLDFATGASQAALSLSGSLDAQSAALAFGRQALGDAEYQQRLAALLGAGASERFASATPPRGAALPATTTVSGQIKYTDSAGGTQAARTVRLIPELRFWQIWGSATQVLGRIMGVRPATRCGFSSVRTALIGVLRSIGDDGFGGKPGR